MLAPRKTIIWTHSYSVGLNGFPGHLTPHCGKHKNQVTWLVGTKKKKGQCTWSALYSFWVKAFKYFIMFTFQDFLVKESNIVLVFYHSSFILGRKYPLQQKLGYKNCFSFLQMSMNVTWIQISASVGPVRTLKAHLSATVIWAIQGKREKRAVQVCFLFHINKKYQLAKKLP